MKLTEKKGGLL